MDLHLASLAFRSRRISSEDAREAAENSMIRPARRLFNDFVFTDISFLIHFFIRLVYTSLKFSRGQLECFICRRPATHTDPFLGLEPVQVDTQKYRWVEFSERVMAQLRAG